MRAMVGVVTVLSLMAGCGKKDSSAPNNAPAAPATPAAKPVDTTPAPAAKPAADFDTLMKDGAALEDQKKWSEALAKFEAAVAARPDDARALAEVGFAAYFAGNLDRAKEASTAAVLAAKDDKVRASALFNLGLAVEKADAHAAASLYGASIIARPNTVVASRLQKIRAKAMPTATPEGDALLAKVNVKPIETLSLPSGVPGDAIDQGMMIALSNGGLEWESGAGKSVLLATDVECHENHQTKAATYDCTNPALKGKDARAIVDGLVAKKVAPTKEHGDVVTYKVAQIRCRSFDEGEGATPDECEVTP